MVMVRRVVADPAAFVRSDQFMKAVEGPRLKPFRRWREIAEQLRKDPSLLAYYDFQEKPGEPSVLSNLAANGDHLLDGMVKGAAWGNGRMAGKHALRFNGPSDYVQVNLPQKVDDLTLAAWVQVDSFGNNLNSLLMSEDYGQRRHGQISWQLAFDGRIGFDV